MKKSKEKYDYFLLPKHLKDLQEHFFTYFLKKYPADFEAMCRQRLDGNIKYEIKLNGIEIDGFAIPDKNKKS